MGRSSRALRFRDAQTSTSKLRNPQGRKLLVRDRKSSLLAFPLPPLDSRVNNVLPAGLVWFCKGRGLTIINYA